MDYRKNCKDAPKWSQNQSVFQTDASNWWQTSKWKRSCPPFWTTRRGILRTVWWLPPKVLGETKRTFNTRKKEHINYIKHFHPEKSALAKLTLELDHRMNWSKTQIVAFENDFRKKRFIESFFINSTPNVINKKSSYLFPNIYKATFGCDWPDMRLCFDSFFRLSIQFLLLLFYPYFTFYLISTLLLFYSALSVLLYLLCLFNVISVITTSSNHARLVDFNASLLESPFALMKACC